MLFKQGNEALRGAVKRIEQLPSIQPDTTTHGSNVVKKGGNDEDRTSDDCISRQQAIDALTEYGNGRAVYIGVEEAVIRIEQLPSAQSEIIRCKDCKYYKFGICMKIGANKSFYGFCDWAERGEQDE